MQLEDSVTVLKRRAGEACAGMAGAIALGERGESDRAAPVPVRPARTAGAGALATLRSNYDLQQGAVRDSYGEQLEKLRDTQNAQARHKNEVELIRSIASSSVEDLERKFLEHESVASAAQIKCKECRRNLQQK